MRNNIGTAGVGGRAGHHFLPKRGIRAGIPKEFCLRRNQQSIRAGSQFHLDLGGMTFGMHQQTFPPAKE